MERYPLGCSFIAKYKKSPGGGRRGPYYVARFTVEGGAPGVQAEEYVGGEAKKAAIVAAHKVVTAELEAAALAAETPELRRVRELEARAGKNQAYEADDARTRRVNPNPSLRGAGNDETRTEIRPLAGSGPRGLGPVVPSSG